MKTKTTLGLILTLVSIFSCDNNDSLSIPTIDGLSLYWDHEIFGDEGRRLRFEATTNNEFDNDYDLEFQTSINDKTITATLTKTIDKGKCQWFPMPTAGDDDPSNCNASGVFYLADKELSNGTYSLTITTPTFRVTSKLTITDELATIDIPANEHLSSSIKYVYPIPKNILFGSVFYKGSNNTDDANEFLVYLSNLGLIETTVPNYPYRHLAVDETGRLTNSNWQDDNYSIGVLYKMNNVDIKTIFEESKKYFDQTNLNISLFTSNGDEAHFSKSEGITIVYSKY